MEKVNRYNNSRVYKIWTPLGDEVYYGSTYETLNRRFSKHKHSYKYWLREKYKYVTSFSIFEKYGIDNCLIELVENVNCNSKQELSVFEGRHIKNNVCVNKKIEGRTQAEYYRDNIDVINQRHKTYYADNKQNIIKQHKDFKDANKELVSERRKQYRDKNKDVINERQRQYYLRKKQECEAAETS